MTDDPAFRALKEQIESSPTNDPRVLAAGRWFANQGWNVNIAHLDRKAEVENRRGANHTLDLLSLVHAIIEAQQ
jgi:hypothetical protein